MYEKERVFENMERDKTFLGTEPIRKLLVKLAVPTVIAQLVNMIRASTGIPVTFRGRLRITSM